MTFSAMPMISTPTMTPLIAARPPASETPPRTQAEITESSNPVAAFGWPEVMREASRMPAMPQTRPCSAKIQMRMLTTLTPASREASGLPPIASVFLPKTVRLSTKPKRMKRISMIQIGVGTVRKRDRASW